MTTADCKKTRKTFVLEKEQHKLALGIWDQIYDPWSSEKPEKTTFHPALIECKNKNLDSGQETSKLLVMMMMATELAQESEKRVVRKEDEGEGEEAAGAAAAPATFTIDSPRSTSGKRV